MVGTQANACAKRRKLTAHVIRQISVEAGRDPRTVVIVLRGGGGSLSRAAVENALERLGWAGEEFFE